MSTKCPECGRALRRLPVTHSTPAWELGAHQCGGGHRWKVHKDAAGMTRMQEMKSPR